MSQPDNNRLNHYEKNRVFQNIIESSNIFLLLLFCYCSNSLFCYCRTLILLFCYCSKKLCNCENFIPRRLSDHNKITFAINYIPMSHLGEWHRQSRDYCQMSFFVAITRFYYRVKNKEHIWGFGFVGHLKITSWLPARGQWTWAKKSGDWAGGWKVSNSHHTAVKICRKVISGLTW